MNERNDARARAIARLQALRNSVNSFSHSVEEKYVLEYHSALETLKSTGTDTSEFVIPPSAIAPHQQSYNTISGQSTYSREKYVERPFMLAKLDAILGYLAALGSENSGQFHGAERIGDSTISQTEASDESHYDVFLSYSGLDEQDAHSLFEQMETDGFKVYFAKKSLQAGDSFSEEIRQALIRSSELWVLITPNSLASEWVTTEWGAGWALGKRIVPILLRCEKQQLPDRLRALHCIDYHDYRRALEQLSKRIHHTAPQSRREG